MRKRWLLVILVLLTGCRAQPVRHLEDPAAWTPLPADGVGMRLSDDGGALRLDFQFTGGGYAIARREVDLDFPENYAIRFRLKGEGPANHLELKLVDAGGENVWWHVRRDLQWPARWETVETKKRHISFAWGPDFAEKPGHVAALEFAVTASQGGSGSVWIDDLEVVPLPVPSDPPPVPVAQATSAAAGHAPENILDDDDATWWAPADDDPDPALLLDLREARAYGGLSVEWADGRAAGAVELAVSDDGKQWRSLTRLEDLSGEQTPIYQPETESRWIRLNLTAGPGGAPRVAGLRVRSLAWSATREAFLTHLANEARPGLYPPGFRGRPTHWTVVGVDRDPREGLLGAGGAVEAGPGQFSVEPFVWRAGRLVTWADTPRATSLVDDDLPLPRVSWQPDDSWRLHVTALGVGPAGASSQLVRYRLQNTGATTDTLRFFLAVRPFQVNPPVQFLNIRGGHAPIGEIGLHGRDILVDGVPRVRLLTPPDGFGARAFAGGDIVVRDLARGVLPATARADDSFQAASAAALYRVILPPGGRKDLDVLIPLYPADDSSALAAGFAPGTAEAAELAEAAEAAEAAAMAGWREKRDRVGLRGPAAARETLASLRAQLGYILVNRAGPRIQPGARSYARSWIRDGALTGVGLLRLGHPEAVRDFLTWYAPHQYENGKIPCVVDSRGADPVPEHDSTGEFIHLLTEYTRYTGRKDLARAMWPRVQQGIAYLESLLDQRRTPAYQTREQRPFYGILPPSISHEGYAAKPMHSYWDDFLALRGYKDAVYLADLLGESAARQDLQQKRDRFARDLGASVAAAMQKHGIDYVPGCADLGDFDATSTTVALDPAAAQDLLPAGALDATFDRYWDFFTGRRDGEPWEAFTPYEVRTIGTFVRLGRRDRAQQALAFFLDHRTPAGWRQWAEVVASDPEKARFIGDMPHTWVGSDFIRGVLDMFAYEDRAAQALVLAAGLPASWLDDGGVTVENLPTPFGKLNYSLRREGAGVVMEIGQGLTIPAGGLILDPPVGDGRIPGDKVRVTELPARVIFP
ncbi:hypothetical protein CSB20_01270 [bacterium DOLZORAL124_64_63]|nr:MAG: hypothetical protein CSB20_01270 [bacterium DOLZORAL124_64_63]